MQHEPTNNRRRGALGALGGPHTFGDQTSRKTLQERDDFTGITYHPLVEDLYAAVAEGAVLAACAPEQASNAGFLPAQQEVIVRRGFHVMGETRHEYHCALLAKPGTQLAAIRKVVGHTGSISQSRRWLQAHLPHAEIEILHANSRLAAEMVQAGDGSIASVGTPAMGEDFGLELLQQDIDGGAVGNYWLLSAEARFSEHPGNLVVTCGMACNDTFTRLVTGLGAAGYHVETVTTVPDGRTLFHGTTVLRLRGRGKLEQVQQVVADLPGTRLAGAFDDVAPLAGET